MLSYSVPLVLHNNLQVHCLKLVASCELLSYSVPLVLHNNPTPSKADAVNVVNCFHIQYLWYYTTTNSSSVFLGFSLWIAFIFSTFGITQQLRDKRLINKYSCELLSYSVPLVLHNNPLFHLQLKSPVVNCFHIQYLWYYTTTIIFLPPFWRLLWIAFIFSTFGITQQHI